MDNFGFNHYPDNTRIIPAWENGTKPISRHAYCPLVPGYLPLLVVNARHIGGSRNTQIGIERQHLVMRSLQRVTITALIRFRSS